MRTDNTSSSLLAGDGTSISPYPLRERGVALVVALIFLLVLTILGVTVMNISSLEGRMAGNTQETNRAFQGAESAVENVFADGSIFNSLINPGDKSPTTTVNYPGTAVKLDVTYTARRNTPPRSRDRSNTNSAITYGAAVFDMKSTADTTSLANAVIVQGVSQVTPKNQ
jgi:Tfp pilus assembly protein PilX